MELGVASRNRVTGMELGIEQAIWDWGLGELGMGLVIGVSCMEYTLYRV